MKPSLQLKLTQHLALTPQLQQSIRLLQLSTIELEQELEKYLLENPLLEREEEYARTEAPPSGSEEAAADPVAADEHAERPELSEHSEQSFSDDAWPGDESGQHSSTASVDDEDSDYQDVQAATVSLREHLLWQLGLMTLPDRDRVLVRCLVDALDDDGYLTQSLAELAETIPAEQ